MGLIEEVFPNQNPATLKTVWDDVSSRHLILQKIGQALYAQPQQFFTQDPTNQLIALLSQARFQHTAQECVHVTSLMMNALRLNSQQPDILPHFARYIRELDHLSGARADNAHQVTHVRKKFGGSCLVSLAFFYDALHKREKVGYPSPEWYREQGKHALYHAEMEEVTNNFERWEAYLSERFN